MTPEFFKIAILQNAGEKPLLTIAYDIIFMINELHLPRVPNFIALGIYFLSGTKFFWNEENDTCFSVECLLLGRNFDFLGGYLVVTARCLMVTTSYCSLLVVTARYLVVTARSRSLLLVPTFRMNDTFLPDSCEQQLLHFIQKCLPKGLLRNWCSQKFRKILRKTTVPEPATLLKKRLWNMCFAVNFVKFLRAPFLTEYLRWLFLAINSFLDFIQFFGIIISSVFIIYYLLFILVLFKQHLPPILFLCIMTPITGNSRKNVYINVNFTLFL